MVRQQIHTTLHKGQKVLVIGNNANTVICEVPRGAGTWSLLQPCL